MAAETVVQDVVVSSQGSVVMFQLQTDEAREWVEQNVATESWQWMGGAAFAVDHRYAGDLAAGMQNGGLSVELE